MKEVDPWGAPRTAEAAHDPKPRAQEELDRLWDFVDGVAFDARSCHEHARDENAWCGKVVEPLMKASVQASRRKMVEIDNMYAPESVLH